MPNITFEYTRNLNLENLEPVIISIHKILENELPTNIGNCKTGVVKLGHHLIGDDDKKAAFMRMTIHIMPGRSAKLLKDVSAKIIALLKDVYMDFYEKFDLQISVSIVDLPKSYHKISNSDL